MTLTLPQAKREQKLGVLIGAFTLVSAIAMIAEGLKPAERLVDKSVRQWVSETPATHLVLTREEYRELRDASARADTPPAAAAT
jgi:hypothetical protein